MGSEEGVSSAHGVTVVEELHLADGLELGGSGADQCGEGEGVANHAV